MNIQAARQEGYSDKEIADYISQQKLYNISGARKEGYGDAEILDHIMNVKAPEVPMGVSHELTGEIPMGISHEQPQRELLSPYTPLQKPPTFGQQFLRGSVEALPAAGAMGGGAVAGGAGLLSGPGAPAVSPLLAVGGSALGAGIGKEIKDLILQYGYGEQPKGIKEDLMELGQEMAYGALGGVGAGATEALAAKTLRPAGRVTQAQRQALELAKREGLAISPKAIVPSKTAKAVEWISEKLPPGGMIKSWRAKQLEKALIRMQDDFIKTLPKETEKFGAGVKLGESIKALKGNADKSYKLFKSQLEKSKMPNLTKAMDEVITPIREAGESKTRTFLNEFQLKKFEGWTPEDINKFQSELWKNVYKESPNTGKRLLNAFMKDIGTENPVAYAILKKAKEQHGVYKELLKTPTGKAIMRKYATDPTGVIQAAFQAGNFDDVALLKKSVDQETWDIITSRFVENMLDLATDTSTGQTRFMPAKFVKAIDKYGKAIKNVMPEVGEKMEQFSDMVKLSLDDLSKKELSRYQDIASYGGASALAGAAYTGNVYMAVPVGFNALLAKSLTNPSGWAKKWLTTGILPGVPKLAGEAVRVGTIKMGEDRPTP
jgi:hypothetical protein